MPERKLRSKLARPRQTDSVVVQHPAETTTFSTGGIVALLILLGVIDPTDEAAVGGIIAALALLPALVTKIVNRLKEKFGG